MTSEAGPALAAGLTLFHTEGCHLCELAEALAAPAVRRRGRALERIDIAGDDALERAYGVRIPVLRDGRSGRELGWPFDAQALEAFLDASA